MVEIINEQCSKLLFDEVRHLKLWRGRPKYLPEEVVMEALSLEKSGKSYPDIAEVLGFSRAQVHNTLTKEKLSDRTMRFISNHGDAEFIKGMILELRSEKNWKARLTKHQAEIMLNQHAVESLYSATYVEDYLDSMENLPDDVMKQLTKMKEMDVHFQKYLNDLESQMKILLDSQDPKKESSSKLRLQNVLMSAQDKGDEKLQIVQQVQDFVDNKVRQLELDEKNLDVFITEFGKDIEHDSRHDSKSMDHPDRPSKRARRARHDVYVPSILGPSTLEATSFSDSIRPGMNIDSRHIHHNTNTKSVESHASTTHNTSIHHNTSTPDKSSSVAVTTPIKSNPASASNSSASHSASNVQTSSHNETTANSNKSTSNISNSVVDEKPNYNQSSSSSSGTTTNPTSGSSVSTTPKKQRDQQQKKEVQEKKHKRRKAKQSDNSPPNIPIDPDEPTYCLCDQVSYGEMIGCDNDLCPIEWFHFSCVQLTTKPKGKWYCPKCRGDRPNVMKPKAIFLKELEKYNREKEEKS